MKKYITFKDHKKILALQERRIEYFTDQLGALNNVISSQRHQIARHDLELRRAVADAKHGTLRQYVNDTQKRLEEQIDEVAIHDHTQGIQAG